MLDFTEILMYGFIAIGVITAVFCVLLFSLVKNELKGGSKDKSRENVPPPIPLAPELESIPAIDTVNAKTLCKDGKHDFQPTTLYWTQEEHDGKKGTDVMLCVKCGLIKDTEFQMNSAGLESLNKQLDTKQDTDLEFFKEQSQFEKEQLTIKFNKFIKDTPVEVTDAYLRSVFDVGIRSYLEVLGMQIKK